MLTPAIIARIWPELVTEREQAPDPALWQFAIDHIQAADLRASDPRRTQELPIIDLAADAMLRICQGLDTDEED